MPKQTKLSEKIANLSPEQRELLKQKLAKVNKKNKNNHDSLSFSQERIWFLQQLEPDNPTYNRPTNFNLIGKLNIGLLEKTLNQIISRHEVFRTKFISNNGIPKIETIPELTLKLSTINLENLTPTQQEDELQKIAQEEAQQIFDLTQPHQRAEFIVSPTLFKKWNQIRDEQIYIVDVSIACLGEISKLENYPEKPSQNDHQKVEDYIKAIEKYHKKSFQQKILPYRANNEISSDCYFLWLFRNW